MLGAGLSISTRDKPFSIAEIVNLYHPVDSLVMVTVTVLTRAMSPSITAWGRDPYTRKRNRNNRARVTTAIAAHAMISMLSVLLGW